MTLRDALGVIILGAIALACIIVAGFTATANGDTLLAIGAGAAGAIGGVLRPQPPAGG